MKFRFLLILLISPAVHVFAEKTLPNWAIGPFVRPVNEPVIKPVSDLTFDCPMRRQTVRWAESHTFNPAAVVRNKRICVLFRAEDGTGDHIGRYTSRIGLAVSDDGITFQLSPNPVLYPAEDSWKGYEWMGGCEDPRVVEAEDGSYVMYYTMWNRDNPKGVEKAARIGVATSRDLKRWIKHGPVFATEEGRMKPGVPRWHKAAGVVQKLKNGRLITAKINGKYWMYWGEHAIRLATSTDLVHWEPVRDKDGGMFEVISPRKGCFDSLLTEVGPPPVLTDDGIVLIYNGKNDRTDGDSSVGAGAYAAGQILLDKEDPGKVLDRLDKPFLVPELEFEMTGQYKQGTVFAEGLILHNYQWFLYYGTADTYVGVVTAPFKR